MVAVVPLLLTLIVVMFFDAKMIIGNFGAWIFVIYGLLFLIAFYGIWFTFWSKRLSKKFLNVIMLFSSFFLVILVFTPISRYSAGKTLCLNQKVGAILIFESVDQVGLACRQFQAAQTCDLSLCESILEGQGKRDCYSGISGDVRGYRLKACPKDIVDQANKTENFIVDY